MFATSFQDIVMPDNILLASDNSILLPSSFANIPPKIFLQLGLKRGSRTLNSTLLNLIYVMGWLLHLYFLRKAIDE